MKLLSFHIYIMSLRITTYQYILREREQETKQKHQSKVILEKKKMNDKSLKNGDLFNVSTPRENISVSHLY